MNKGLFFGVRFALTAYSGCGPPARGGPTFSRIFFLSPDDGGKKQPKKMPRRAEISFAQPSFELRLI
jgi:hypothetical protein